MMSEELWQETLNIRTGQIRQFNESDRIFTLMGLTYDDRDIWNCKLEDGTIETHSGFVINFRSNCIGLEQQ